VPQTKNWKKHCVTPTPCVHNFSHSIFIDRNSGGKTFREILTSAGLTVVLHDDIFKNDTADEIWLKEVAARGHIVVTGDKDVTRRILFLKQLVASKAYVFILYGLNGASPQGKAGCVLSATDKITELLKSGEPPALWKIANDNRSANRCDHDKILAKMYANRRV
jgi:predicted nuclease of predicted toxin-antitoxin system